MQMLGCQKPCGVVEGMWHLRAVPSGVATLLFPRAWCQATGVTRKCAGAETVHRALLPAREQLTQLGIVDIIAIMAISHESHYIYKNIKQTNKQTHPTYPFEWENHKSCMGSSVQAAMTVLNTSAMDFGLLFSPPGLGF